jgi:hypothetical protein
MLAIDFMIRHICYFPDQITHTVLIGNFSENIQRCVLNDIHDVTYFKECFSFYAAVWNNYCSYMVLLRPRFPQFMNISYI